MQDGGKDFGGVPGAGDEDEGWYGGGHFGNAIGRGRCTWMEEGRVELVMYVFVSDISGEGWCWRIGRIGMPAR